MPVPAPVPAPPPLPDPCETSASPGRFDDARRRSLGRREQSSPGMFSCSIGSGSSFGCFERLELRRLLDRNRQLVLARQLRLARRLASSCCRRRHRRRRDPARPARRCSLFSCSGSNVRCRRGRVAAGEDQQRRRSARWKPVDARTDRPSRLGCCSNRNGTSSGCSPSTWTDRCPAEVLARTAAGWVVSAIGNGNVARRSIVAHGSAGLQLQKRCLAARAYSLGRSADCRTQTGVLLWSEVARRSALQTRPVQAPIAAFPPPYECRTASASAARGSLWMATSTPPRPASTSKMRPSCA